MLPPDASTSPRGVARVPSRLRTFQRKYLRADLRPGDIFLEPSGTSLIFSKPSEFLRAGSVGRWAQFLWRVLILLVSAGTVAMVIWGFVVGAIPGAGSVAVIFMVGLLIFAGGVVLASQAYLRWMIRNWHTPRRPQRSGQ